MGQTIWGVLDAYRGKWVAVDRDGKVLDADQDLGSLRARTPRARTFIFACSEAALEGVQEKSKLTPARVLVS
ncbi:MAG: hypothetical protein A2V88_06550 [Elusimicrobia bacterium RBG_16_66_12]|nr:MAG: hypothetical protein A2V88_06550 [Elusimicrobia bacterium RBG_16_66_12]